ncbi:MAG: nucleoside-diphosphate kinase [Thiotrichales bacterium 34-46-19]|nr:nucleoside-diphosphate kinase [Gammaproteobacteria bacterium]OYY25226.1 MAG: nucleoside-diphosphate kinase [Thiotrichales bacterium 35-46-9]OZA98284.1 MAG: nucleoside-diphosphate kinase [Thiotrichales bacterium 34-46-19]OZB87448.1 MAG: nucleoside-diphosphate kinase [Thiotrichales bacterium 12-47-6]HQR81589.1 nucleoside-diphosphate kinase [Thiotrichales bacterium]
MAIERTLSIIKPDAVGKNAIGQILAIYEQAGLRVAACKMLRLSRHQAEAFYAEHEGKPFYRPLVDFMLSGPVVVSVLTGEDAIAYHRQLMGTTDPATAAVGTVRAQFANSTRENAVHGSDSVASAEREINFFFDPLELCR